MPQINIKNSIDASFLAKLAKLGDAWGAVPHGLEEQTFSFMSMNIDAVEQALEDYDAAYLAHQKTLRLEALADKRRIEELKGPGGLTLDDKTVLRLTAKALDLTRHPEKESVRWEVTRGNFAEFPRDMILGIADQATAHVESCFEIVYLKTEAIKAVELTTTLDVALSELYNIDINSGWPE